MTITVSGRDSRAHAGEQQRCAHIAPRNHCANSGRYSWCEICSVRSQLLSMLRCSRCTAQRPEAPKQAAMLRLCDTRLRVITCYKSVQMLTRAPLRPFAALLK